MKTFYPELVNAYEESIKKPPKKKRGKINKKDGNNSVKPKLDKMKTKRTRKATNKENIDITNLSLCKDGKINISLKVNKLKRKLKNNNKPKNQKTIDSFLSKRRKSMKKILESLRNSFGNISLESVEKCVNEIPFSRQVNEDNEILRECNNSLSLLDLSRDDVSENDLSNIVDKMVNTAPASKTVTVNNKLVRLVFAKRNTMNKSGFRKSVLNEIHKNCSTPRDSPVKRNHQFTNNSLHMYHDKTNTSFFFDKLTEECDAFEMSLDYKNISDCDKTVNYSLNDVI